jgi:3-oxoacyl-[acyl-carrier protein] reductase
VTGGSRGLGAAIAHAFAAAGANVMITARDKAALADSANEIAKATGRKVSHIAGDVSRASDCEIIHAATVEALGPVDILVNNAGASSRGPFQSLSDEDWQSDLDLKLFAAIRLCRLVLPGMRERGRGRVINMLSIVGKAPAGEGAPTNVSRAAGIALTKVLSKEYAGSGITVNGICLGKIRSAQWERFWKRDAPELDFDSYMARESQGIPAGRHGEAEELAAVVKFLASDEGSYVNGVALNVDGGLSPVV